MRDAVHQKSAGAADPLAAIRVERNRIFSPRDQPFVDDVEQFEERHIGRDVARLIVNELPGGVGARLAPDA